MSDKVRAIFDDKHGGYKKEVSISDIVEVMGEANTVPLCEDDNVGNADKDIKSYFW